MVYVFDINCNIPTMGRRAHEDNKMRRNQSESEKAIRSCNQNTTSKFTFTSQVKFQSYTYTAAVFMYSPHSIAVHKV